MINDERDFQRDRNTNALINTNKEAYLQYKRLKKRESRIDRIEESVDSLSQEISEVKSLLKQILDKE